MSLYVSNAGAESWTPVVLPVPEGKGAFPIAAAMAGGRRYLAGAVYDPTYGRSYLDAAVWVSDGGSEWRLVDAPAFSGDGNQTIFSLDVAGATVVAGGGDGALVHVDTCCFYPDGIALWRTVDRGDSWSRMPLADQPYGQFENGAVVGFVSNRDTLQADARANPPRSVVSHDRGASWVVTPRPRSSGGVMFPAVGQVLHVAGGYVATTVPEEFCADCTQGALAHSNDGDHWQDVTPRFPCGTKRRASYGFVSSPVAVGSSLVALGGCGEELSGFNETLLATSTDDGTTWRIKRFTGPTGGPIPAVEGSERIVTLTGTPYGEAPGNVRAVVAHP